MTIKWTHADINKRLQEAITPKTTKGNGRVLIEQMKRMARKGQMPKPGQGTL